MSARVSLRKALGGARRRRYPAVSIVMATHNRPAWLRTAIDSVLRQDYPDLELLVIDDGSTDDTPDLLRDYARRNPSERFRFLRHQNMGQA
jgi:glycosyltransferase involved in cell wall biosynthesis